MLGMRGRSWARPCGCLGHLVVVSTTQDDALQNEMELVFPYFFLNFLILCNLEALTSVLKELRLVAVFLGK